MGSKGFIGELKALAARIENVDLDELADMTSNEAEQVLRLRLFHLEQKTIGKEKSNREEQEINTIKEKLLMYQNMKNENGREKTYPSAPSEEAEKNATTYRKEPRKSRIFHTEIPRFSGKTREDISRWLYEIEISKLLNELSDEEAFNAIVFKIEGVPFDMHRNYNEKQKAKGIKPEYKEFIKMLRDRYVNRYKVDQDRENYCH